MNTASSVTSPATLTGPATSETEVLASLTTTELLAKLSQAQEETRQATAAHAQRTAEIEDAFAKRQASDRVAYVQELGSLLVTLGITMPADRALDLLQAAPSPSRSPVFRQQRTRKAKGKGKSRRMSDEEKVALFSDLKSMKATGDTIAIVSKRNRITRWTAYCYARKLGVALPGQKREFKQAA